MAEDSQAGGKHRAIGWLAAAAPGWLRKPSSNVWQTFTAGPAAAAGSSQQVYLGIKAKGRRGGEGKKQGAAYF